MEQSSDSRGPHRQDVSPRSARGGSVAGHEGNLIDFSSETDEKVMEPFQEDLECSSPENAPKSKEKSFCSQVMEFLPIGRGSPEKRSTVNTNKRAKSRQELEEEILKWREACTRARKERRDAVSKLKKEEEEHGATKAAARQKLERLENDFKSARDSNENTKRTLKSTEREIARLRSEAHRTKEEFQAAENASLEDIAHLTSDVDIAKQELYEEKSSARKEIAQLRSQIKVLSEKNDKFRQMLIPVAEKQVLDAEVVQKFTSLRSSILALVRRTWKLTFPEGFDLRSLSQTQKSIFKLGSMDSYDRLRYAVFQFIFHGILGPRNYFLKDGFKQTEQGLQMAEQELFSKSPAENGKLVLEWRSASFKATELFRDSGRQLSRNTQDQVWNYFGPLQTASPAAEEFGRKKLEEICDAAVDFSLSTRQLKDYVFVDDLDRALGKPVSEWDHFVEEIATAEMSKEKQPGTIAYVIVGALIKNPSESLEKELVLEKAEVAVYR